MMKFLTRIIGYPVQVLYYYKDIIYVTIIAIIWSLIRVST